MNESAETIEQLDLMDGGTYRIHTSSGTVYQVVAEPDGVSSLTRQPAMEGNVMPHDGSTFPVFQVLQCKTGHPAGFLLFSVPELPESYTELVTTRVQKIVKIA